MTPLSLEAPAKLNLSLRVVGRRPDGYHLLESEMVLLELADRLLLLPGATGLRVEAPPEEEIPVDRANLAWRGLLAGIGGEPELVCLALEKHVPTASGLGGGSSDAAAAWRLGRRASGADEVATADDLAALSRLGADIPFFAARTAAARVGGIGSRPRRSMASCGRRTSQGIRAATICSRRRCGCARSWVISCAWWRGPVASHG